MPVQRSLAEILRVHGDALKSEIRKCLPGTVTAVDAVNQTVDVQLAINGVLFDELGTAVSVPAPSLSSVPLGVLRGGGFLVWVPVKVGDSVLVMFSDLSCDVWQDGPVGNAAVDPGWVGVHTHDSPFAIPMVSPAAGKLLDTPTDQMVIGLDDSDQQIRISGSLIQLGFAASDFVALASKVTTELNKLNTALTTATYIPGTGAPVVLTPGTPYVAAPVAATIVKAQ